MPDVAREINENGLDSSTTYQDHARVIYGICRYRYFSLLMAKDQFTSHYDTPGIFDKNLRVCHQ